MFTPMLGPRSGSLFGVSAERSSQAKTELSGQERRGLATASLCRNLGEELQ